MQCDDLADVLATGTISGDEPGSYGSLLELSWNGTQPVVLPNESARTFLQDGDTVILRGRAGDRQIDFGEVSGQISSR